MPRKKPSRIALTDNDLRAIVALSQRFRLQCLLEAANLTRSDVATQHPCSVQMVCNVINDPSVSSPVQRTMYALLQKRLGNKCPGFELVFDPPPEDIRDACNG